MSKVPKWKVEKAKIKVVFRLQFHATHIPQTGWDKLFLSFIPAETGKPSAKTNKANVRNGNCKWSDPIYEATRLLQDTRTKKYDDKLYKLIIAMGSSRATILGEADINLAEFVDALKPLSISLPLHGCDFGTILHVTVQILTTKTGFREFEQQSVKSSQLVSSHNFNTSSDITGQSSDYKNTRPKLRETNSESTEDNIDAISSHTSDSIHCEKTEIPLFPLTHPSQNPQKDDFAPVINRLSSQVSNEWTTPSWGSDYENCDLAFALDENNRLRVRLEVAESAFLQLKTEAKSLQRISEELGLETQRLAHQLAQEIDSGQSLVREVSVLKNECEKLKRDFRELGIAKPGIGFPVQAMVLIENKVNEIRDKACIGFDFLDSDFEALLKDIEGIKKGLKNHNGPDNLKEDPLVNKEKVCELLQKLEDSKTENEILVNKMNQMERYYESFIHQLEESHKDTIKDLETLKLEHSASLYTNSVLESQIERLHEQMQGQVARFGEEREALEQDKEEMKRRAVASETALKRVRRNYTGAVERLQKDLELLSFQVLSMYECNETLNPKPLSDLGSNLDNLNLKSQICSNGDGRENGGSVAVGEKPRCFEIRADMDFEVLNMYVGTVQLRVFSDLLVDALNCANKGVKEMKKGKCDLERELIEFKRILKEREDKCEDLEVKIRNLEGQLQNVSEERDRFEAKIGSLGEEINKINGEKEISEKMKVGFENKLREAELDLEASRRKLLEGDEQREKFEFEIEALKEETSNINKMKVDFENKFKEAELDLEASRRKLLEGDEQKEKFEFEIEALKEEINNINKLKVDFENKLRDAELDLEASRRKLLEGDEQKEKFEFEIEALKEEISNINKLKVDFGNKFDDFEAEIEVLKEENNNINNIKVDFENKLRDAELDLEGSRRENGDLMAKLKLIEIELEQVNEENKSLVHNLQEENIILNKENVNLENLLKKIEFDSEELKNLRELQINLESDLEASRRKLEVSSETIEKLEREKMEERESFSVRSETETKLGLIETNLNNCEDELKRTKIKLVNCETEKRDLEDKLEILREKKGIFENLLKQAESDLQHSNKTIEKLEQELREVREIELKDSVSKFQLLEIELKNSVSKLELMEIELKDYDIVKEEKTKLEKELQILEKNKDDFEKNAQNIQREFHRVNERFDKENSELKSKLEFVQFELEQLKNEYTDLNKKFHESESRREEIERNKVILEDEIIELNLNLSDLNAQVEEREKEIVLFYEEKTKLRERIVELEKTNISMQNVISRNEENQIKLEFENRLIQILQELVASDVEANYMQSQLRELSSQFNLFKIEIQNRTQNKIEISNFKNIIEALETEVEFLKFSKEEVEILNLIFKSKLEEQDDIISKLKESKNELGNLRVHQRELTRRLSEQTLKTEEYKNLSFHFKEKIEDLNNNQAIEKRETESLRMVFIKEQYESKIQEMKSQLLLSNKYSEEMLLKLQNALDEVETSKKNEICLIKKVEEISVSLSDLEREIKGLKTEKRELISELDNLKTELECSSLSFDCLKEEKTKLEICFQECNEERRKLKVEVDLVKRLMENMALNGDLQLNDNNKNNGSSIGEILETGLNENLNVGSPIKDRTLEKSEGELNGEQAIKDEHFEKHQNLKIALSLFQKELEKLKNENISYIIPQDGDQMDPSLNGLERALSQLDSANEHLGSIFPSFKALSGSGNALERVLALELELVEALQDKKRSDTRFQSSFLKQHNDEDAIFQSFRDINELIQDMLQLKKRNVTTENELREMHGRYSQLSIQFAELEGERQKLMMSLKNRSPRKL